MLKQAAKQISGLATSGSDWSDEKNCPLIWFGIVENNVSRIRLIALWLFLGLLTCVLSSGCRKGGLPGTIPVRGKVIYDGRPLGEGEVLYNPVEKTGRRARGVIQSDGTIKLTTLEKDDGALPGEYRITILAYAPHPGEPGRTVESESRDQIKQRIKRGYIIPERYIDPELSGLADTVDKNHSGFKELVLEK